MKFIYHLALNTGTLSLLSVATVVSTVSPSQAAIINGGFETGDFTGWQKIGLTSVVDASFGSGPTEGTFQALLSTEGEGNAVDVIQLESFLGLNAGDLNNLGNGIVTEGSAIKQTFSANAGDVLKFDFNFLTNELTFDDDPLTFNDFAFFSIASLPQTLADTSFGFVSSPPTTGFADQTGFQERSFIIPSTGTYTLGIGVVDVGNRVFDSGLSVDRVPEPLTILGSVTVLGVGALLKKEYSRRLKKATSEA